MKKKPYLSFALAAGLAVSTLGVQASYAKPAETPQQVQPFNVYDNKVLDKINVENIYNNIEYLSRTPRVAGTQAEHNAIQYVKEQFESYGYETELQEFTFYGYTAPHTVELTVDGYPDEIKPKSFTYGMDGTVSGELVYAGLGQAGDFEGKDVSGKIALIQRGSISFADKVLNAAANGAAGVIIFNNAAGDLNGTFGSPNEAYVPAVAISQEVGQALVDQLNNGDTLTGSINIEGAEAGMRTSYNVIATKAPTNKNKAKDGIVALGAHHDSVPGAPGANDDASGTAMTLELARVMKDLPTNMEMRFITFGAEELGLIGSRYYVSQLSEEEKDRFVGYFNMDMVGSRDAGDLVINTPDGNENIVSQTAQASSERLNGEPTPIQPGGSSDHVSFYEGGIASGSFNHRPLEPWYHTPEDTIDKISKEKLQDVAEIVGTAVYDIVRPENQGPKVKRGEEQKVPHLYYEEEIK
ncbi:M20/M25/M40 family metallo-hydrolase [Bacillus sp. ISL-39]|uniref:M20/M25/M40 family metallo-hydrolase n=1 Tax=Bacillus sp. ISL-39 TaxID=2819124 RepID=UPI001BEACF53|nr:M20/M25/M40 family metallo-hydrolase [Bacillus sp. ISL-39]MBT2640577.1 M20/M25/M40 family metallo-hydrolase [Bacillus sp. ISL-39]